MFRGPFAARRCTVSASLFYEWRKVASGKRPCVIARANEAPPAFGGIREGWRSPEGEVLGTVAISTTAANQEIRELHDRTPLVLEQADLALWLGEESGNLAAPLRPSPVPDGSLRSRPVSPCVNSPRKNGASLIEPMRMGAEGGGSNPV